MANVANIVEAVGATVAAGAVLWKPIMSHRDRRALEKKADDLFLHGANAIPGLRLEVVPAAERLTLVEEGVKAANHKLDDHGVQLSTLSQDVRSLSLDIRSVAGQVTGVAHEVHTNQGGSLHDTVIRVEAEQARVAIEHQGERKADIQ